MRQDSRPRSPLDPFFIWFLLAGAVILIYITSLRYPFFWVDPIDIGLAHSRSILTILTNSEGYLYYRPFAFILWKTLRAVAGRFDPLAFHLLQVVLHLINSGLMYLLTRQIFRLAYQEERPRHSAWPRFFGPDAAALLAALCFAWYPPSYQTVTWVISPQLPAMMFTLAAANTYITGRLQHKTGRLWLSLLLLALALPFHENAVLFGPILIILEAYLAIHVPTLATRVLPDRLTTWISQKPDFSALARISLWPLAHLGLCLAFMVLWFLIPKDPESAVARFEPATGWYLLQGLIWPVAGAVASWREWLSEPAWRPLLYTAPPVLLAFLLIYYRARRLSLLALGLAWFGLMVLPVWATRGIGYAGVSPRIFYTAAPGAIFLWAGLLFLRPFPDRSWGNKVWSLLAAALLIAVLGQSLSILGGQKQLHDSGMTAIWDVVETGSASGDAGPLLYINVPDQMSLVERVYPVGYFQAVLMPVSVDLGQYVELQTEMRPQTISLAVPALAGLEQYPYQVNMRGVIADAAALNEAIRAAAMVFISEYDPAGPIHVVPAGAVRDDAAAIYITTFADKAKLSQPQAILTADRLQLTFNLACRTAFSADETLFVHLVDPSGQLIAQADGDPLRQLFPLSACQPGELIHDIRYLPWPTTAGLYTVHLGLYNRATGERLPAFDSQGQPLPDNAVTITVDIP